MGNYKTLSLIQAVVILIVGLSVFDFGFVFYGDILDPNNTGIGFNDALWPDDASEAWNPMAFWAYGFFAVGVLQILKALGSNK